MENQNSDITDFLSKTYLPIELRKYIFQIAILEIFQKNENYIAITKEVMALLKKVLPLNNGIRSLKNELLQFFIEQSREYLSTPEEDYSNLNINEKNEKLREALFELGEINLSQAVNAVIAGADVNLCIDSSSNRCPLAHAALLSLPALAILLLIKGADINFKNGAGRTPLMIAAHAGAEEVVKILLDFRADTTHVDVHNETALDIARINGNESIIKMLEEIEIQKLM